MVANNQSLNKRTKHVNGKTRRVKKPTKTKNCKRVCWGENKKKNGSQNSPHWFCEQSVSQCGQEAMAAFSHRFLKIFQVSRHLSCKHPSQRCQQAPFVHLSSLFQHDRHRKSGDRLIVDRKECEGLDVERMFHPQSCWKTLKNWGPACLFECTSLA